MRTLCSVVALFGALVLSTSSPMAVQSAAASGDGPQGNRGEREPVILVHGWAASPDGMSQMRDAIAAARYRTYVAHLPGSNNIENARTIARIVDTALSETHAVKVHLVGHSMGGLSMRYYVKRLGGAARVRTYVAFGTPQYGYLGACALDESQGGQMCPWSAFLADLNAGDDTPGGVVYSSFRSAEDTPDITRLDGGTCTLEIAGVAHADEPRSPLFAQAVLAALGGTCPGSNVELPIE